MDRTSWIGVLVCLTLLFGWGWWTAKEAARIAAERPVPVATDAPGADAPGAGVPATTAAGSPVAATPTLEASAPQAANAPALEKTVLENDIISLRQMLVQNQMLVCLVAL
ncbi:MAG: hypothetical protein NWQ95_03025, partial [Verrucomicrobiales bacterium]|nr:hypothetical protein [Verrucomicrobiales bacterium]